MRVQDMEKTALVFSPHNDDETLGAGGTILKLAKSGYNVVVCEVTSGKSFSIIQPEAINAHRILGVSKTIFLELPTCQLEGLPKIQLNEEFYKESRLCISTGNCFYSPLWRYAP